MTPISNISTPAAQPLSPAERADRTQAARQPEAERRSARPAQDEYLPEEKREPTGLYWPGRDEDGRPKIYFDAPEPEAEAPEDAPRPEGPDRSGEEEERWACDTGEADREIERLKKRKEELERQLSAETGEARTEALERQLAQVERELKQKDNDTYRKQHSTVTKLS